MFDSCVYSKGLSDGELKLMRQFGIRSVLLRAIPDPRSSLNQVMQELKLESKRLSRFDITPHCALATNSSSNGHQLDVDDLARAQELVKARAIGPCELKTNTSAEIESFSTHAQLCELTRRPLLIASPSKLKERRTRQTISLLRKLNATAHVVFENGSALTSSLVHQMGLNAILNIHHEYFTPLGAILLIQKYGAHRFLLGSGAGLGPADILAVPRMANEMKKMRLSNSVRNALLFGNALKLFGI
jgi:predicted metal-dependent TIM-barrel fold hydrolase